MVFHVDLPILIGANLHAHAIHARIVVQSQRLHRHGGIEIAAIVCRRPYHAIRSDMLAQLHTGADAKRGVLAGRAGIDHCRLGFFGAVFTDVSGDDTHRRIVRMQAIAGIDVFTDGIGHTFLRTCCKRAQHRSPHQPFAHAHSK